MQFCMCIMTKTSERRIDVAVLLTGVPSIQTRWYLGKYTTHWWTKHTNPLHIGILTWKLMRCWEPHFNSIHQSCTELLCGSQCCTGFKINILAHILFLFFVHQWVTFLQKFLSYFPFFSFISQCKMSLSQDFPVSSWLMINKYVPFIKGGSEYCILITLL